MRFDCFHYTETNRRPWAEQVSRPAHCVSVEAPATATLAEVLALAYAAGMAKGSQRAGCFEVQSDVGSWLHHNPQFRERGYGKLDPAKAVFLTLEQQLDAA